jgi:glycosyltransferase involved in cell wall biosynthesis
MYQLAVNFPIHNEEKSILKVLNDWKEELDKLNINYCLVISEDGSTDNTKTILKDFINKNQKRTIDNIVDEKRGYTDAVISGIKKSNSEFILCIDSDGQCDPKDFFLFWNNRHNNTDGVTIGIRNPRKDNFVRLLCSQFFGIFHFLLFPNKIKDPSCPFVLFNKKIFYKIDIHLNYVVEAFWWLFTAACIKEKIQMQQIIINHKTRISGDTQVYKPKKFPSIFIRNLFGLIKLKFAQNKL